MEFIQQYIDEDDDGKYFPFLIPISQDYESNQSNSESFFSKSRIRISTAPARPLTDIEEFKRSPEFMLLEQTVFCSSQLIHQGYQKYDLDTPEGQKRCKKFLNLIEKLCDSFNVHTTPKDYRNEFSNAYQILYKEGSLNYLTEILDSAQEGSKIIFKCLIGFPYLFVNGEKYVFSPEVLEAGNKLLTIFYKLQQVLKSSYSKICQEEENYCLNDIRNEMVQCIKEFDGIWAKFEQLYVMELMIIENDARRYIAKAMDIEKDLQSIEIREKMKGKILVNNDDYHQLRKKFCKIISQINSVANFEGKGRDDLSYEILLESEGLIRRISPEQSKAVRNLADKIRASFMKIRRLFRYYEQNIDLVDPQLKNNQDLVDALQEYESSWEKGKTYFMDGKKCNFLIHFSHVLETTAEKYISFKDQLEFRDADIFVTIPSLLVLKSLENEDKSICMFFLPEIFNISIYKQLKLDFQKWKNEHNKQYLYYNLLEKVILGIELVNNELQYELLINNLVQKIRQIAIEMERKNPLDWNNFLEAALNS